MIAEIKIVFSISIINLEIGENPSPVSRWKLYIFKYIKKIIPTELTNGIINKHPSKQVRYA